MPARSLFSQSALPPPASILRWPKEVSPVLFIVPALVVYSGFFISPLVKLPDLSLYKWDGILARKFIGLRHYQKLLGDERFW